MGSLVSAETKEAVAQRYASGTPAPALAADLGVHKDTVIRWAREAGARIRSKSEARALRHPPLAARFRAKYAVAPSGCWEWTGAVNEDGYGLFRAPKEQRAHRYSYKHHVGPIPSGTEIDHACHNRRCVNPAHLRAVSHAENVAAGANHNRSKVHCRRGHELTGIRRDGKRYCKECGRLRQRKDWRG